MRVTYLVSGSDKVYSKVSSKHTYINLNRDYAIFLDYLKGCGFEHALELLEYKKTKATNCRNIKTIRNKWKVSVSRIHEIVKKELRYLERKDKIYFDSFNPRPTFLNKEPQN